MVRSYKWEYLGKGFKGGGIILPLFTNYTAPDTLLDAGDRVVNPVSMEFYSYGGRQTINKAINKQTDI